MAFFGLTKLGPQDTFRESGRDQTNILMYSEKDIKYAWERTCQSGSVTLRKDELEKFMQNVYEGGPWYPKEEYNFLVDRTPPEGTNYKLLLEVIAELKELIEAKIAGRAAASEFTSNLALRESRGKNVRPKYGPTDLYSQPLTSNQDLGWGVHGVKIDPRSHHPKVTCEETKYADEMVKSQYY